MYKKQRYIATMDKGFDYQMMRDYGNARSLIFFVPVVYLKMMLVVVLVAVL